MLELKRDLRVNERNHDSNFHSEAVSQVNNFIQLLPYHSTISKISFDGKARRSALNIAEQSFGSNPDSVHFTFKAASGYRWKKQVISGIATLLARSRVQIESYAFSRARDVGAQV